MTAAVMTAPLPTRVRIRPAPRRDPPFDDELPVGARPPGPHDRRLPFDPSPPPAVWMPRPARPSGLPDPAPWTRRLLVGMIETAAGRRPLQQLTGLLSPSVLRGLGAEFERATRSRSLHWLHRASVRSVRATEPSEGIAELCATLDVGQRVRAVALRLECQHGRWRCTRLQLG